MDFSTTHRHFKWLVNNVFFQCCLMLKLSYLHFNQNYFFKDKSKILLNCIRNHNMTDVLNIFNSFLADYKLKLFPVTCFNLTTMYHLLFTVRYTFCLKCIFNRYVIDSQRSNSVQNTAQIPQSV